MASSPDDKGVSHMEIIAKIATLLIDDDFVAFFKDNQSEENRRLEETQGRWPLLSGIQSLGAEVGG